MESTWTKQYINSIKQIVRKTLRTILGNHRDFEDVEQEAVTRAFSKRDKIPTGIQHDNYIRKIAKNCAYDILRRKYRLKHQVYEVPLYSPEENEDTDWLVYEHYVSYEKEMSDPFVVQMLAKAISQLSPEHQRILLLKSQELEYKEMATLLNISEGTVRSRLHYAKKICAKHLAPNLV